MKEDKRKYAAYLLRLWLEPDAAAWRIQLRNIHTGELRTFPSGSDLLDHLHLMLHPGAAEDHGVDVQ